MKKKILAIILSMAMVISIAPVSALATDVESYESIKQRVSSVYGIPLEIVDTLSEEKVRGMDVDENQVISAQEQYIHYVVDDEGNSTAIPSTEEEYLEYAALPVTCSNPKTEDNGWMKIYLIIINNGATLDISSTYTWLIQPRVTYGQHDMLTIAWENGSYVRGSAEGFYSYQTDFAGNHSEDLNSSYFKQPTDNPKSINYAHPMNDSGARKNEFFHMMVTIEKNTGLSREYASSSYSQQYKSFNLAGLLGGASGIVGAFYIPSVGAKALCIALAASSILAGTDVCYETYTIKADAKVN